MGLIKLRTCLRHRYAAATGTCALASLSRLSPDPRLRLSDAPVRRPLTRGTRATVAKTTVPAPLFGLPLVVRRVSVGVQAKTSGRVCPVRGVMLGRGMACHRLPVWIPMGAAFRRRRLAQSPPGPERVKLLLRLTWILHLVPEQDSSETKWTRLQSRASRMILMSRPSLCLG